MLSAFLMSSNNLEDPDLFDPENASPILSVNDGQGAGTFNDLNNADADDDADGNKEVLTISVEPTSKRGGRANSEKGPRGRGKGRGRGRGKTVTTGGLTFATEPALSKPLQADDHAPTAVVNKVDQTPAIPASEHVLGDSVRILKRILAIFPFIDL